MHTRSYVLKGKTRIPRMMTSFLEAPPDPVVVVDYEKSDLPKVNYKNCSHLSFVPKANLLNLLQKIKEMFDGTLGDFQTDPLRFNLNLWSKSYHRKSFLFHTQKKKN